MLGRSIYVVIERTRNSDACKVDPLDEVYVIYVILVIQVIIVKLIFDLLYKVLSKFVIFIKYSQLWDLMLKTYIFGLFNAGVV